MKELLYPPNTEESGGCFKMKWVMKETVVGLFPSSPSWRR
jgi:hypothetical protein